MKRFIFVCTLLFAMQLLHAQLPKVTSGTLIRHENFKSHFVTQRHLDVWLPEGYTPHKKYAVLYMHDGQMLFDSSTTWNKSAWEVDEVVSQLLQSGQIKDLIVVGIWNGGETRHSDYFPQKPFETLPQEVQNHIYDTKRNNGLSVFNGHSVHSDNYLKFMVNELKPFIDSAYSTKTNQANTFVAGSSMGGLISLYAICEYPNIFGGAACLSTHWSGIFKAENNPIPDAFIQYLNTHLPRPKHHRLYFDHGTATLDSLYPPFQLRVDELMKQKGYTEKHWITKVFPGEDHSEKAWHKRLAIPLTFLLRK